MKPSWFWTISAAETWSSIVLSIDPRMPAANTVDEHHEREADHQRRGGDRGALRLADRVLAREHAGQALQRASGAPSTRASGRTSSGARNAKPNIISTAPRPSSEAAAEVASMPAEEAEEQRDQADAHQHDRADDAARAQVADARA